MPPLLRKLIIIAAADGLILHPHGNGTRYNANESSIRIDYKTNRICPISGADLSTRTQREGGLEVFGLVGKRKPDSHSIYLLSRAGRYTNQPGFLIRSSLHRVVLLPNLHNPTTPSRANIRETNLRDHRRSADTSLVAKGRRSSDFAG